MPRFANFVEETTTSIAGTSGNGAVTLTALANTPRFSTVFGTGTGLASAHLVRYVIEDTVNKKYETGLGSIDVSTNVLTRTRPQVTWNGTTYNDNAPSALAFGSTPNSGDIRIRCAMTAEHMAVSMPASPTSVGNFGDTWWNYPLSAHFGNFRTDDTSAYGYASGLEVYAYYKQETAGRLTGLQFEVTSVTGTVNQDLALYALDANGLPSAKLIAFGVQAISTTGVKTLTSTASWTPAGSLWLNPDWYAVGFLADGNISFKTFGATTTKGLDRTPLGRYGNTDNGHLVTKSTVLTAMPAVASLGSPGVSDGAIWFGLKVTP
jgi:hypothetical protein